MRIYLDPGHGGLLDPGCVYNDVKETDLVWAIVKKLAAILTAYGCYAGMSRNQNEDPRLHDRATKAGALKADLAIAVHANAEPTGIAMGARTYYWPGNERTKKTAGNICRGFPHELAPPRTIKTLFDPYAPRPADKATDPRVRNVLAPYYCDAILIECGFISHDRDRVALCDNDVQERIALAIATHALAHVTKTSTGPTAF